MQLIVKPETPSAALARVGQNIKIRTRYDNFIGGQWVAPTQGRYFENRTPISGELVCEIARSTAEDIEKALDAAHAAADAWGKTAPAARAAVLFKIADRMEANLPALATVETSTTASRSARRWPPTCRSPSITSAISPAASARRKARCREIDETTIAYHFHEPLGVVGQIIPWNFPILMAVWKLAPALAAGNCVVLKPAEQTPMSIMVLMDLIGDLLPPGVLNVVNGFGVEAGKPLASNPRIAKIAFTGETTTGRLIMQYAVREHHPRHAGAGRQVAEHLLRRRASTRTTRSSTRRSRASPCSPSTRARCAPVPRARSCRRASTTPSWSAPSSA